MKDPNALDAIVKKKRGRPKAKEDQVPPLKLMDKLKAATLNCPGVPAVYASTTKGAVKLIFDGHHFRYSYRKGQYSIFQCCYKENKEECKVKVVSDQKYVYPYEGEHVHFVQATDKSATEVTFNPAGDEKDTDQIDDSTYEIVEGDQNITDFEIYGPKYLTAAEDSDINPPEDQVTVDEKNDPNDFREKIKQRLQRALQGKKK